jgi:hypothetical protein
MSGLLQLCLCRVSFFEVALRQAVGCPVSTSCEKSESVPPLADFCVSEQYFLCAGAFSNALKYQRVSFTAPVSDWCLQFAARTITVAAVVILPAWALWAIDGSVPVLLL